MGLRSRSWSPWYAALQLTESLGRSGAALVPTLREMTTDGHTPARAAVGLWQVTGEADETLPVLLTEWSASPRRHNNDDDDTGNMRYDVPADVALQLDRRRVLTGFGERIDTPVR